LLSVFVKGEEGGAGGNGRDDLFIERQLVALVELFAFDEEELRTL